MTLQLLSFSPGLSCCTSHGAAGRASTGAHMWPCPPWALLGLALPWPLSQALKDEGLAQGSGRQAPDARCGGAQPSWVTGGGLHMLAGPRDPEPSLSAGTHETSRPRARAAWQKQQCGGREARCDRPGCPRCRGMTSATCSARSCTAATSRTTGTAGCAGPTWRSTSGPRCWRARSCWPPASRSPPTWTTR